MLLAHQPRSSLILISTSDQLARSRISKIRNLRFSPLVVASVIAIGFMSLPADACRPFFREPDWWKSNIEAVAGFNVVHLVELAAINPRVGSQPRLGEFRRMKFVKGQRAKTTTFLRPLVMNCGRDYSNVGESRITLTKEKPIGPGHIFSPNILFKSRASAVAFAEEALGWKLEPVQRQ